MENDESHYSHRLHDLGPYNIHHTQGIVAHEELMQSCNEGNGEGADTFGCKIFPPTGITIVEPLVDLLADKLGELGEIAVQVVYGSSGPRLDSVLLVSDVMVISLCRDHDTATVNRVLATKANGEHSDANFEKLVEWILEAGWNVGHDWEDDGKVPVSFAYPSKNGVHIMSRSFEALPLESIQMNYSTDVIEATEKLIAAFENEHNGIAIISGPSGTGKSYLIRAILTELRKKRNPLICTPPGHFLTNMGDLTEAVISAADNGWIVDPQGSAKSQESVGTLVVMEDVGEMLVVENVTTHVNETANLLNMSDGIMALMSDTVFLMTFNHEIDKINPALLRPGRCLGNIVVDRLPWSKAQFLVPSVQLPTQSYTLAEVYEMNRTGELVELTGKKSSMRV